MQVQYLGQEDPLEEVMAAHSVFLPGESHGQKSLVGYSHRIAKSWSLLKQLSMQAHEIYILHLGFVARTVKNLPAVQET